ncbi:MAG TPA: cytochrome C biogenesis protein [Bacteroidetes bacterium]|nr:cytochrome C biogenesis protein [Bacteroidota bacterium]
MKKVLLFSLAFFAAHIVAAQLNPVKWSYEAKKVAPNEYDLVFTAHISDNWYLYSQYLDSDEGPIPTSFSWPEDAGIELAGKTAEEGQKHEGFDRIFEMNVVKYSHLASFTQRVKTSGPARFSVDIEYMTCDETRCLPPTTVKAKFNLK